MQCDLFHEISLPAHRGIGEAQAFAEFLAQAEQADRLGFGTLWLVEHHFMPEYSHSSAPDLLLAAASQRTHRLRLGLGVTPLPYHHPLQVAERAATLDVLTQGRLEMGIGRGFSPTEFRAFGIDMAQSRERTAEGLDIMRRVWAGGRPEYHGRHYDFPPLQPVPAPLQHPHPPLWTAAVSPDTFIWAAQQQLGVLAGPFKPWWMVRHDIGQFLAHWQTAETPRAGMTVGLFCLPDGQRARKLAEPAFVWFYRRLFATTLPVLEKLYPSYEHFHDIGRFRALLKLGIHLRMLETLGMVVAGSPEQCVDQLARYREAGVTHLLCAVGAGALDPALIAESMQCIAEEVMPALA